MNIKEVYEVAEKQEDEQMFQQAFAVESDLMEEKEFWLYEGYWRTWKWK